MATAQTGSGKTGAMLIPIINYLMGAGLTNKPRGAIQGRVLIQLNLMKAMNIWRKDIQFVFPYSMKLMIGEHNAHETCIWGRLVFKYI